MKKKRKIQVFLIVLGIFIIGALVVSNGSIREEWRMRKVARQLEASTSIKEAYGSNVSVSSLEHGVQGGTVSATWVHHSTPFRVIGEGVDETIWVKWRHPQYELDIVVKGIADKQSPDDIPAFANP